MGCVTSFPMAGFAPSGMTKSGSAQALTGSYATITTWTADTTNYPGSTVSSNGVVAQGGKSGATVAASLDLTGGFSYSASVRILVNGSIVATGSSTGGTPMTVSTTTTITSGDVVTVQGISSGVSNPSVATGANSWVRIT